MEIELYLDDSLVAEVKSFAIETNRSLSQVVEDCLKAELLRRASEANATIKLHTSGSGGVQPSVDLSNNAALQDLMDDYDGIFRRWT